MCFHDVFHFCQGMKNRIRGRVTDRIECYGVFVSPCRFSWPFMMGQQTRDFRWFTAKNIRTSFGQSQKIEIDKALTLEHYTPNKVFVSPRTCPWIRFRFVIKNLVIEVRWSVASTG